MEGKTIRLDWTRLLGFDQAERTREELQGKPEAGAMMAKLSVKPGAKATRKPELESTS